jgi:hypothetical protein
MTSTDMPRTRLKAFIKRRRWALATVAALLVGGGSTMIAVAATADNQPDTLHVRGTLTLRDPDAGYGIYTQECIGEGGYDDIAPGAQVTVTAPDGTVLAVGHLGAGGTVGGDGSRIGGSCVFPFEVAGVPAGRGLYGIEVSHRGVVVYQESDLSTVLDGPTLTIGQ